MTFKGQHPYGTPGGFDTREDTDGSDVRTDVGNMHVSFLIVNGPIAERTRTEITDIIRILSTQGEATDGSSAVTLIFKDNGTVIDSATAEVNFTDGIEVTQVSSGVVSVYIPSDAITGAMLQDAIVSAAKLANGSVTEDAIASGAVTASKLAVDSVGQSAIQSGAVGTTEIADDAVTTAKLSNPHTDVNVPATRKEILVTNPSNATQYDATTLTVDANVTYRFTAILLARGWGFGGDALATVQFMADGVTYSSEQQLFPHGLDSTVFGMFTWEAFSSDGVIDLSWKLSINSGDPRISGGFYMVTGVPTTVRM